MTGEIEEPFRYNFQSDLLHSGSISFGRFESESLSWERRSAFTHNRYLEEVERYSKPGSVTEKKAYFEAHFRRKALLKKSSSECRDRREFLTSENDEESDNGNETRHFPFFDDSPCSSGPLRYDDETGAQKTENENVEVLYAENGNGSRHVTCYEEIPHSSSYDEGTKVQECESQNCESLSVSAHDDPLINMNDHLVCVPELVKLDETNQSETGDLGLVNPDESIEKTCGDKVVHVDVVSEVIDSSLTSHTAEKDDNSANSRPRPNVSPKVRPASEAKYRNPKLKAQSNVARFQRTISSEASKGSMKPGMRENEVSFVKNTEKMSPRPASPITHYGVKASKAEDSSRSVSKAKLRPPKKSTMNDSTSEKTVEAQSSIPLKSLPEVRHTSNRPRQNISSSKPYIIQSAAGFSFKSDQRAERRKEEKPASDVKQFRKSLSFKATPMPSFYNESACGSDRHKVMSTSKTPNRPITPSSYRTTTRTNPSSSNYSAPSDARPRSSTSSTTRTRPSEIARKTYVPERKEQEQKRDTGSKKQKEPELKKAPRGRDMSRKDTIGVRGSRSGSLAVNVTS